MDLVEKCQLSDFSFEVFRDNSGTRGLSVFVEDQYYFLVNDGDTPAFRATLVDILSSSQRKSTFGLRKLRQLGFSYQEIEKFPEIYDVQLLSGTKNLFALAREQLDGDTYAHLADRDERFRTHLRAVHEAQMDTESNSLLRLIPANVVQTMLKLRCQAVLHIFQKLGTESWDGLRSFSQALFEIEENQIHVDPRTVDSLLKDESISAPAKSFVKNIRHLLDDNRGEMVSTRFSPNGTRTGRIKVDGSEGRIFNCMSIPHGPTRKIITSRYEGGQICSVDLNAADYRCIIASLSDDYEPFKKRYADELDFHLVNCEMLLGTRDVSPEVRNAVKQLTYVSIYGGSPETICEHTGLSLKKVLSSLELFEYDLAPIHAFVDSLFERSMAAGYVELPNGRRISVEKDDHKGKVVGLYAQSYSSLKFELALVEMVREFRGLKSKILFTVHDEVVIDEHPEEPEASEIAKRCLERNDLGWRLVAKIKKGKDYFDATE